MKTCFFDPPLPRLIAHRGFSGRYPENTLSAFQAAVDEGCRYLELDIWLSRDKHLMVHHDRTCERICNDSRAVPDATLAELKTLDAGWAFSPDGGETFPFRDQGINIPTLEEVLTAFPETFFTVEIKEDAPGLESILLETIHSSGKEDSVLIGSVLDEVMPKIRRHCFDIPTGCSHSEAAGLFMAVQKGEIENYRVSGEVLHLPMFHGDIPLISAPLVKAAHYLGLEVHVWTINQKEDMEKLLALEVDGVTSDFPDLLIEVSQGVQNS
jgi:glycerophosphoryl diester phosphodiesterase